MHPPAMQMALSTLLVDSASFYFLLHLGTEDNEVSLRFFSLILCF